MNVLVLVEQVAGACSERTLRSDCALDRDATDAVLDEINERAVEADLQLKEAGVGSGGRVRGRRRTGVAGQCRPHIGIEQRLVVPEGVP